MWNLISSLLKDPGRLKAGLEEMIEQERAGLRGDPDQEAKTWLEKLSEVDQERRGYLRLAAKGVLADGELDEALAELEETREMAERELRAISARRETLEKLERDKEALLGHYARMTPDALDALEPEERHQVYKMLRLTVEVCADGSLEVSGVLGDCFVSGNQDARLRRGKAATPDRIRRPTGSRYPPQARHHPLRSRTLPLHPKTTLRHPALRRDRHPRRPARGPPTSHRGCLLRSVSTSLTGARQPAILRKRRLMSCPIV